MGLSLPEDVYLQWPTLFSVQDAGGANCRLGRLESDDRPPTSLKWLLFWAVVMEGGFSPTASVLLGHVVCYSEWARGSFRIVQAAVLKKCSLITLLLDEHDSPLCWPQPAVGILMSLAIQNGHWGTRSFGNPFCSTGHWPRTGLLDAQKETCHSNKGL